MPTGSPYELEESDLEVGVNTALDLMEAQYIATITPKMEGWFDLTEQQRIASLLGSFKKIKQLKFCIEGFSWIDANGETRTDISLGEMTAVDYMSLPEAMRDALSEGAMATSISDMDCDNADMQRADGIMQSRTSETSHMYRSGHPIRYPVPRAVVNSLGKWLCTRGPKIHRSS